MQEPLDRLRALKNELENTSFLSWDKVDIWGKKALPTIAKNWSEHLDEFKSLLKKPIYPGGVRLGISRPDPNSSKYIFSSPGGYQEDQREWLESERRNKQQSEIEAAGYRQNCENAQKRILAFLDGIIHETENSVAMPATTTHVSDYVNVKRIDELRCVNGTPYDLSKLVRINSPDSFLNGFTRLSGLTVPGSSYFFKVSFASDFDNKIPSTVESGFEA